MLKKVTTIAAMLVMVLATAVPASATFWDYGSCADFVSQEEAQKVLEDPNYGHYDPAFVPPPGINPEDIYNLDPDGVQ